MFRMNVGILKYRNIENAKKKEKKKFETWMQTKGLSETIQNIEP